MGTVNDSSKVIIVVPVYNEKQSVLAQVIADLLVLPCSIVIVDDGSDIPVSIQKNERIHVLKHFVNLGQGAALQTGFEFAKRKQAEYIVTFDADGQHRASDIEQLLLPLKGNEADICLGSRFMTKDSSTISKGRMITLKIARAVNFLFSGVKLSDAHNGLRAFNHKALQKIFLTENRMAHATEIIIQIKRSGLRCKEIPVSVLYTGYSRKKGQSPLNGLRIFLDLFLNKFFE